MRIPVLLMLFSVGTACAQDPATAHALVREGVVLHDDRSYIQAIAKYDAALEADKDNFLALAEKCHTLCTAQRFEECIALSDHTLAIHGANDQISMVLLAYANSLDHLGRAEEALIMYRRAQEASPEDHQLWYNEGVTLAGLKRYDEAVVSFQQSAMRNPEHASSHNGIARIEAGQGERVRAVLAFARFLILEPESGRAKANLELMKQTMEGNVERTGKKNITIRVDASRLPAEGDTARRVNDFTTAELMLAMLTAADMDKKNKKKEPSELFSGKLDMLIGLLEDPEGKQSGFYWEYYVPFFRQLKQAGHLETAAMVMQATAEDEHVSKWIRSNEAAIKSLYAWCRAYEWPN
ncbi:MAG: tetratricopeptide repeat protein [Flavobacteriales bacterium]|jgi:tetratricopeptide (TPR) repeat protein|nr:tetratricopeptide repeat protein [Flavobacteriales bacterium]